MARTITKAITTTTIAVFDPSRKFELDENGMPQANVFFERNGNVSLERAQKLAEVFCKNKNVMAMSVQTSVKKSAVSPSTFYNHSHICIEGQTYGHDTITQEFVFTYASGFYIDAEGMHKLDYVSNSALMYFGKTTANKYLNHAREVLNTNAVTITELFHGKVKRWMSKDEYDAISRVVSGEESEE